MVSKLCINLLILSVHLLILSIHLFDTICPFIDTIHSFTDTICPFIDTIHPFIDTIHPLFTALVTMHPFSVGGMLSVVLFFVIGKTRPHWIVQSLLGLAAFVMSIAWLNIEANEVVSILESFGLAFNIDTGQLLMFYDMVFISL